MAYNTELADRVRDALAAAGADAVEQSMFGGLAFMVGGHMTVGLIGDDLMVRVGREPTTTRSPAHRPAPWTSPAGP